MSEPSLTEAGALKLAEGATLLTVTLALYSSLAAVVVTHLALDHDGAVVGGRAGMAAEAP